MGSGLGEWQGNVLTAGASGLYRYVKVTSESLNQSTGKVTLTYAVGTYVSYGNFYGTTLTNWGTNLDSYQVYGANVYNEKYYTFSDLDYWNSYHFNEGCGYTSSGGQRRESGIEFYWYPTLPEYTITYNANGGTGAPSNQTKRYGFDISLSSQVPTRENYNFIGWATSSSATAAAYQPGSQYGNGVSSGNADLNLYAVWELAYIPPSVSLDAYRVASSGSAVHDPNGAYVHAIIDWAANPMPDADDVTVTSITATLTEDGTTITPPTVTGFTPGASGSSAMDFAADTTKMYILTVTVTDSHGISTIKSDSVGNIKYPIYVYHDNDEDYVKIENLELGNPAFARASLLLGAFYGAEILYENWNNQPAYGTTLSKPCTDYKVLVVVCKDNDGAIVQPAIVPGPTIGGSFNVTSVYPGAASGTFYFKSTTFKITSSTMIEWAKDGNNWQTGEMGVSTSGNTWTYTFRHAPVFIVGIKA